MHESVLWMHNYFNHFSNTPAGIELIWEGEGGFSQIPKIKDKRDMLTWPQNAGDLIFEDLNF